MEQIKLSDLKVGDMVRQIHLNFSSENPIAKITKIVGNRIYHIHKGVTFESNCSFYSDERYNFELVESYKPELYGLAKFCKENYK